MSKESIPSLADLEVTQYELHWEQKTLCSVFLERVRGQSDIKRWAIRQHRGNCLGKTPESNGYFFFTYESLPSSRDEDYYREYRWSTAVEAHEFWVKNRKRIAATPIEYLEIVREMRGI